MGCNHEFVFWAFMMKEWTWKWALCLLDWALLWALCLRNFFFGALDSVGAGFRSGPWTGYGFSIWALGWKWACYGHLFSAGGSPLL